MKIRGIFICFFICALVSSAQNKKWILGSPLVNSSGGFNPSMPSSLRFYQADFSGATPLFTQRILGASVNAISSPGINETLNSAIDSLGNIAFYVFANPTSSSSSYTSDATYFVAFDPTTGADEVFASLPSTGTGAASAKDLNIIKRDGYNNQYYVIYKTSATNQFSIDEIKYLIVDMNTKSISTPITLLSGYLNEGMAVSLRNCSMNNRWFFSIKYSSGNLQIYRSSITSTGISSPILINTIVIPGNTSLGQGDIEISSLSDKIAFVNYTTGSVNKDIIVFDLNLSTGVITNERWIDNPGDYIIEIEFSPDGQRLYAFRGGTSAITPELYNIQVPPAGLNYTITPADKLAIGFVVGHTLEVAYDNKLYFATSKYNTNLHYISNPNANAFANIIATTATSSFGAGNGITYTLPEQIDGDNGTVSSSSNVSISSPTTSICIGESIILTASGGNTYQWSGGAVDTGAILVISPVTNTNYIVTGDGPCGVSVDSITIQVNSPSPAQFVYSINECGQVEFQNGSIGAEDFFWDFGDGNTSVLSDPFYIYSDSGYYNVTLVAYNSTGCSDTITEGLYVGVYNNPVAEVSVSSSIISIDNQSTVISNGSQNGVNCILYFGNGDSLIGCNWLSTAYHYEDEGLYTITQLVTNANGCSDTTQINILVEFENTFFIPNAFTPNSNGSNDFFHVYGVGFVDFKLMVFDRWGELVFETNDIKKGWDGKYKGRDVAQGVFVWKLVYSTKQEENQSGIGHVTVIR